MRYLLFSILSLVGLYSSAAFTQANFAKSSRLGTGKWVKVAIGKTGVYEISYETLRSMGFEDPERVGLYGRGGYQYPENFQGPTGKTLYHDDLDPVPVYRQNDKLYFYGLSTEQLSMTVNTKNYDCGGYVQRVDNNIYSSTGYYFLSDYQKPANMEVTYSTGLATIDEVESGLGIVYHEVDLYHNTFNTGQLFYGERHTPEQPRLRFDVQLPGAIPGRTGAVECIAYGSKDYGDSNNSVKFNYGFEENETFISAQDPLLVVKEFTPFRPSLSAISIPSDNPTFFTEIDYSPIGGEDMETSNLDYWVIAYERKIPTLVAPDGSRMAFDRIVFPKLSRSQSRKIRIADGINRVVFDITDPQNPHKIDLVLSGSDGFAKVTNTAGTPDLVIFDPLMPQMQIKDYATDYTEVRNQNLHQEALEGADLIIIAIPQLKEAAERLADVHRDLLNQRVIVASTEECYNEFTSGTPDPMAYRALVKMAYSSDYGCKNVLFIGPLYADFRGIAVEKNPGEGIIAYQSSVVNTERGGYNNNDFYGTMADNMSSSKPEAATIEVGVGNLPIRYPAELDTYIEKVKSYLERTDYAYYLNRYLSVGGVGDADLHTSQVPEVDKFIHTLNDRAVINSQLAIDAYGYNEAHDKLFRTIDEGISLINYYGHGGPQRLNHRGNFFNYPDVHKLRNKVLPLWGFAGCELTEPDRGRKGLGEALVTSTPYGMIGTLLANRETFSSLNLDFFKKFHANILRKGGLATSKPYQAATTIGEIYAGLKTQSNYPNELAYMLVCDPGIIFPTINRYINVDQEEISAEAGEWLELTGSIQDYNDSSAADSKFNGEIVVRLMEPTKKIRCSHLVLTEQHETLPKEETEESTIYLTYADAQVAMGVGKVENGKFSVKLMIPEGASNFDGQRGRIHLCAYDPDSRIGAGYMYTADYKANGKEVSTLKGDSQAPVIERFEFDSEDASMLIRVSDDLALAYDSDPLKAPFRLMIDGKEFRQGASTMPSVDADAIAYEKHLTLDDLSEGSHKAKVIVRDAAGNEAVSEILFDYFPSLSPYAIALEQKAVDGSGRFVAVNGAPAAADIVILSSNGYVVRRDKFAEGAYDWDACDNDGNRVAPGLYKAYIIETGSHSRKGHSSLIDVPVI